jgi:hypothetical protein
MCAAFHFSVVRISDDDQVMWFEEIVGEKRKGHRKSGGLFFKGE